MPGPEIKPSNCAADPQRCTDTIRVERRADGASHAAGGGQARHATARRRFLAGAGAALGACALPSGGGRFAAAATPAAGRAPSSTATSSASLLDLPLLQPEQIRHLGTVRLPDRAEYPAAGIGWSDDGSFLAARGWAGRPYLLRRYRLPASGTGTAVPLGAAAAVDLSGFNDQRDLRLYGTLQVGGRLLYAASADYNGNGGEQSAFVASLDANFARRTAPQGTALPPWASQRGIVGWFAAIPPPWRELLGGYDVFCGTNCKSIVSNDTIGNGFVAFRSGDVDGTGEIETGKFLLFGNGEDPARNLWLCDGRYGAGENVNTAGAAIVPGTRTLLYFGHQGTGRQWYGEPGGGRTDPCNPYQGDHAWPYEFAAWAYDLRDLVDVKDGRRQPYEPRPYGTREGSNGWNFFGWKLPGVDGGCQRTMYTSGFFDPRTMRIYMGATGASVLHVWQVAV